MGGLGPAPKPAAQRRRRNKTAGIRQLPADGGCVAPPLPLGECEDATRLAWDRAWASPMSVAWTESDRIGLDRWIVLVELMHAGNASAAILSEIRQLEDRFGLSPLARRRLQWEITQAGGKGESVAPAQERKLRAV